MSACSFAFALLLVGQLARITSRGNAAHVLYITAGKPGGFFGGDPVRQGIVSPCSVTNVKLTDVSGLGDKNTADSSQLLFFSLPILYMHHIRQQQRKLQLQVLGQSLLATGRPETEQC
jgi:hypothetical protein